MNQSLVSDWYDQSNLDELYAILEDGDLLEFKRQGYSHWAVYVGVRMIGSKGPEPAVIHRSLPAEAEAKTIWMASYSASASANGENVGPIIMETLADVLATDKVRINNGLDNSWSPFRSAEIIARAESHMASIDPEDYNLIRNNCEHFANRCRYGRKYSGQVIAGCLRIGTSSLGVALSTARVVAAFATPFAIAAAPVVTATVTIVGTAATLIPLVKQACEASRCHH